MIKIHKSITIKASADRVYELLTSPEHLPEIWPSLIEVTNVKRSADGAHSFDWTYKMAGLRFRGHSQTTEIEKNKRVVVKSEKGIDAVFRYVLAGENGETKVTMEIEYKIPNTALEKLAGPLVERLNEKEASLLLDNMKARLEVGVGAVTGKHEKRPVAH
jgi:uncharacterized membrane protein